MKRNYKMNRKLAGSLAVGMSVLLGAAPVFAAEERGAEQESGTVYKEETVYVNADASGRQEKVTVSDWFKNAGSVKGLKDVSYLEDIKNIKGEETFTEEDGELIWNTEGEDIYYQGIADRELPVSVELTYFLDGKKAEPEELKGKSGHLKIRIDYKNNEKKTAVVNGKEEEIYSPFVMVTGLIMPNETFSGVTIDNGKVISDGSRNIVLGFAMPGMKESLGIEDSKGTSEGTSEGESEATPEETAEEPVLTESLEISADVTDFTMSPTFTVALSDVFEDMDIDEIGDFGALRDSLNDLEDAALELVRGSEELAEGADTLGNSYEEFDGGIDTLREGIDALNDGASALLTGIDSYTEGADTLNAGIQQYLGNSGELTGKVTEYVNGVNTVVLGTEQYAEGANELSDGVTAYVAGEQKLSAGVSGLVEQMGQFLEQAETLSGEGEALEEQAGELSDAAQEKLAVSFAEMTDMLEGLSANLKDINEAAESLESKYAEQIAAVNREIGADNEKIAAAKAEAENSGSSIESSIRTLEEQKEAAGDNTELAAQIEETINALNSAKDAAASLKDLETLEEISAPRMEGIAVGKLNEKTEETGNALNTFMETAGKLEEQVAALQAQAEEMNSSVTVSFPEVIQGLEELQAGFAELDLYNETLLAGAEQLKGSSPALIQGVGQLSGGTEELSAGLSELGKQMSDGASALSANSGALRDGAASLVSGTGGLSGGGADLKSGSSQVKDGIAQLSSGASALKAGTEQFEREGTSKMKETVEEELGGILDRLEALVSEDCIYDTYSGKRSDMEGSVKFVIETEGIE